MARPSLRFFWVATILQLSAMVEGSPYSILCSRPIPIPYRLGNFGTPEKKATTNAATQSSIKLFRQQVNEATSFLRDREHQIRLLRLSIFLWCSKDTFVSVMDDSWTLDRKPKPSKQRDEVNNPFVRRNVQRRVERDRYLRKLVGAGYSPRLVWLYGVMLRGFVQCTALPMIFNPPIGWGAGAVLAAKFAVREWLPCILLGWYGSEWYWKVAFGVKGAPSTSSSSKEKGAFQGVPITIQKVKL